MNDSSPVLSGRQRQADADNRSVTCDLCGDVIETKAVYLGSRVFHVMCADEVQDSCICEGPFHERNCPAAE